MTTLEQQMEELRARVAQLEAAVAVGVEKQAKCDFMTRVEVAQKLGVTLRTIDELKTKRLIPYTKIGRCVKFYPEDVEKFARNYRRGAVIWD